MRLYSIIAETTLSLAMNAFIYSAVSYSEVSSRDYLVASIERIHLPCEIAFRRLVAKTYLIASNKRVHFKSDTLVVFESWFRTPIPPPKKLREKVQEQNFIQVSDRRV